MASSIQTFRVASVWILYPRKAMTSLSHAAFKFLAARGKFLTLESLIEQSTSDPDPLS